MKPCRTAGTILRSGHTKKDGSIDRLTVRPDELDYGGYFVQPDTDIVIVIGDVGFVSQCLVHKRGQSRLTTPGLSKDGFAADKMERLMIRQPVIGKFMKCRRRDAKIEHTASAKTVGRGSQHTSFILEGYCLDPQERIGHTMAEALGQVELNMFSPDAQSWGKNGRLMRELRRLRRETSHAERALVRVFEDETRESFGLKKVGEAWKGENELARLIQELFPSRQIIRHYRESWLKGLELDIFLPEICLAFEYQGQQHFSPVAHWGGEEALKRQIQNDQAKILRCQHKGITLIVIDFRAPLTRGYIVNRLIENNVPLLLEIPWDQ